MANLKEVRNRIVSVSSTQQITSAMKMVSAAKLKRAQDAVTQMRPYANKLREILENLSSSLDSSEGVYSVQREVKNVLLVVITSNRGLCGAFNANVLKKAVIAAKTDYAAVNVTTLSIGKKAYEYFRRLDYPLYGEAPASYNELFDKLTYSNVAMVAETLMQAFSQKQFDKIILVYNQFRNAASQDTVTEQLLPVIPTKSSGKGSRTDYLFEPDKEQIIQDLIPRSLKTQLYKALLDSYAAEHGARMTAMHKATDNAKELIRVLKLNYNKARQAAITNEILEIVGGAEALTN